MLVIILFVMVIILLIMLVIILVKQHASLPKLLAMVDFGFSGGYVQTKNISE